MLVYSGEEGDEVAVKELEERLELRFWVGNGKEKENEQKQKQNWDLGSIPTPFSLYVFLVFPHLNTTKKNLKIN